METEESLTRSAAKKPPAAAALAPGLLWRVAAAFLIAALLSSGIAYIAGENRRHEAQTRALLLAGAVAHDLSERLDRSLSSAYALATLVRQGNGSVSDFNTIAREMIAIYGGIAALQLAPGGVISQIEPLSGNEMMLGFSALKDPEQSLEAQRAVRERRLDLAGPFLMRQGMPGVIGRYPVFLDSGGKEKFWGTTQVVIRISELLAATRLSTLSEAGYAYEVWRRDPKGGGRQVIAASAAKAAAAPVTVEINVPNGRWALSLAPEAGWVSPTEMLLASLLAAGFSLLVSFATYLLLRQPYLLQAEVKRRIRELNRRNRLLQSVLAHFPGGISVTDNGGRLIEWNAEFCRLLDFPPSLFAGDEIYMTDFVRFNAERGEYGEVDPEECVAMNIVRANRREAHHFERTRPNGTVIEVRGTPLPDGGFVTSYTDVTERKKAEERLIAAGRRQEEINAELEARVIERTASLALEVEERRSAEAAMRRSAQWLRQIIDTMRSGILLWDANRRLIAWNEGFCHLYPESAGLLQVGARHSDLLQKMAEHDNFPSDQPDYADWERRGQWEMTLPSGNVVSVERLPTSDGGYLVVHTDVTEKQRTGEILMRNERMAALGSLVAGIAHEINTPIGNALMVASTLDERLGEFDAEFSGGALRRSFLQGFLSSARESSGILQRNLLRAASLIQNFKQVAVDQTSDRRRRFDLADVIEEIAMTLLPRIKRSRHGFTNRVPPGIELDSYPGAIGQIISNLFENALLHAFSPDRPGTIEISATPLHQDAVQIVFADDGRGIPAASVERIFDPFFTTRLGQGGSGLGLSIVANLARNLLGGEISVSCREGAGCAFTITLPLSAPQRDGAAADPDSGAGASG